MTTTIFKNFHCCFFKSGHIAISASVPYTGFVGGKPVLFTLKVENTSRRTVRDIKFVLFKVSSDQSRFSIYFEHFSD